jgi:soluble lytic murein transglycosylase
VTTHAARYTRRPSRIRGRARRGAPSRPPRARRRRRALALLAAALLGAGTAAVVTDVGPLGEAVREITLPLRHDDIIRQQAADKGLDPALIAAVIYEESRFRDQTSHAGARGLMQITPETADFIAKDSGGIGFEQDDLATPQINISYGSYFLRYLIGHYGGNETLAIAAYNAGQTNVDGWVERAGGADRFDSARHIPFPETRAYVANVQERRDQYRAHYAGDLGL